MSIEKYTTYKWIKVRTNKGDLIEGMPLCVVTAKESASKENELDIQESANIICTIKESDIQNIEVVR